MIGWISSVVLLLTIGSQIHRQWRAGSSKGVSPWLFVGQMFASLGFSIYSALVHDWVFIVTNVLMLLSAALGLSILLSHRHRDSRQRRFVSLRSAASVAVDESRSGRGLFVPKEGLEPSRT